MKRGLGGGRETREIIEVNEKREDMKEEGVGCCPEVRKDDAEKCPFGLSPWSHG